MNVGSEPIELSLDVPFRIARGTTETTENVVVSIEYGDETGYGAAAPARRYGETTGTVEALLPKLLEEVERVGDPYARQEIGERMSDTVGANPAAKAAVDLALPGSCCSSRSIGCWAVRPIRMPVRRPRLRSVSTRRRRWPLALGRQPTPGTRC